MNLIKTGQLPIVEFLKYVENGQEHLASVIERKASNCTRRVNWVSGTTPRHSNYYPRKNSEKKVQIENTNTDRTFEAEFARDMNRAEKKEETMNSGISAKEQQNAFVSKLSGKINVLDEQEAHEDVTINLAETKIKQLVFHQV